MGWREARNPAAFLVDKYRGVGSPYAFPQTIDQTAQLIGVQAVSGEQDEAKRIGIAKEPPFSTAKDQAGTAEYRR